MKENISYITFVSNGIEYIYDRYSNEFLLTNGIPVKEILDNKDTLKELDVLQPFSLPSLSVSQKLSLNEKITYKLNNYINRLCFVTTEACNLRCKYCVYSGSYTNMRQHNNSHRMTFENAKKAIDLFLKHSSLSQVRTISFYGGESLIEYEFIQSVINYTKGLNSQIQFAVSTNLTLLTEEMMQFLVENKVLLTVSIDGPQEIHDLFRVTVNGSPTHEKVITNLHKIRVYNEEYFKSRIVFNVVLVPHEKELSILDDYFNTPLFDGVPMHSFTVLSLNGEENQLYNKYDYPQFLSRFEDYSLTKFINRHIDGCTDFSDMKISYNYHIRLIKRIYFRKTQRINYYDYYWPNGICILGLRSLFVTSSGVIYPCETLYDLKELSIGNVTQGINTKLICDVTRQYCNEGIEHCRDCWAYQFCAHCFSSVFTRNKYSHKKLLRNCALTKKETIDGFKIFTHIYSQNNHAFDYLDGIGPDEIDKYMIAD